MVKETNCGDARYERLEFQVGATAQLDMNAEWYVQRAAIRSVPQATFSAAERASAPTRVQGLLSHSPLPNISSATGVPQFDPGRQSERLLGRTLFGRLDWAINAKHLLTARAQNLFAMGSTGWNQHRSGALHLTSTLGSRAVKEARVYYTTCNTPLLPLTRFLGDPALNGSLGRVTVAGAGALGSFFRDDSRVHNY